ncbi:ATP-binding protein/SpoIIE family protein phosphatase [Desulfobacterales bacterium HSG16]|nr:ATP-binding protein/SpoIIE family protein phosphatase [Desulfobacterales bacterium HSG16]
MTNKSKIAINNETDVIKARLLGKKIAFATGFGEIGVAEIEIVISELGTNIIKHAGGRGSMLFQSVKDGYVRGIEITARDQGAGMDNVEAMIKDGISSTNTLGIGLSGVKRLMDELEFKTGKGRGTVIRSKKWIKTDYKSKKHCSVLSKPKLGETVSGDDYFFKHLPSYVIFSVIDALGHGFHAHQVAKHALNILENNFQDSLLSIIKRCHEGLKGSRGAAMSIGMIDFKTNNFQHVSIGNVETRVYGTPSPIKPVCTNGTMGLIMENARINVYPYSKNSCIVMFSDGISNKFEIEQGLLRKSPQEISNYIFTGYAKNYDDATVLVVK